MFEVQIGILLTDKVEVQGSKCVKMQTPAFTLWYPVDFKVKF